jgi:glycosyltransferase involved in cell wall biosynthesis
VGQLDDGQAQLGIPLTMMPCPQPETNENQHKRFAQHIGSPRRGDFNIVFTGRFSLSVKNRRVDFFFDAVRLLVEREKHLEKKIKIHLVGEYRKEELRGLKDLIARGIVVNHGFVERSKSLAFQRAANLLLIITEPGRRSMVTAKIFEYLYAGKPILALTHKTVLEDIIKETKTGWIVHPHQSEAIADLLRKIITKPTFYNSIEPDGEKIKRYSIKTQVEKLNHLLKKISHSLVLHH